MNKKKDYDNRSSQRRRQEKAIMAEVLRQVTSLTNDLQNFSKNVRELIRDVAIPTHFNMGEGEIYVVAAFSKESEHFFREKEQNIVNKPVWHFKSMWEKHKISTEHRNKFLKSQETIAELLAQGKPLPDTHVATKFGEKTECFIAHFHREYVYDRDGKMLGHLTFMPVYRPPP